MIQTVCTFISANAPLLITLLSLLVALRSSATANRARRFAERVHAENEKIKIFCKRTEILSEIDRQHARLGSLLAVIAEKLVLFQRHPQLAESQPHEPQRLLQNLDAVQHLQAGYEKQRFVSEQVGEGADLASQEKALADIRRLTIHVDEDFSKELRALEDLKQRLGKQGDSES